MGKRRSSDVKKTLLAAMFAVLPVLAAAEKPHAGAEVAVRTARITAIDHDARLVTLAQPDGVTETIECGPEVDRFDELKVGDTVTMRYYRSVVYVVRKAGQPRTLPATSGTPSLARGHGKRPAATLSRQQTTIVTVEAIDSKVPAITGLTDDGRRVSFQVPRRKDIAGLKVADRVEIVYTEALVISVE
jgi:hypothetical protein